MLVNEDPDFRAARNRVGRLERALADAVAGLEDPGITLAAKDRLVARCRSELGAGTGSRPLLPPGPYC